MSEGVVHGALTIPASGSQPARLATPVNVGAVILYVSSTNSDPIYIGGQTVTEDDGLPLAPGAYFGVDVGDPGAVYVVGTENDTVRWFGTRRGTYPK